MARMAGMRDKSAVLRMARPSLAPQALESDRGSSVTRRAWAAGGTPSERAVGPNLVVVDPQGLNGPPGAFGIEEPVRVQARVAELAVVALDVGVLSRLSGVDEVRFDAAGVPILFVPPSSEPEKSLNYWTRFGLRTRDWCWVVARRPAFHFVSFRR